MNFSLYVCICTLCRNHDQKHESNFIFSALVLDKSNVRDKKTIEITFFLLFPTGLNEEDGMSPFRFIVKPSERGLLSSKIPSTAMNITQTPQEQR